MESPLPLAGRESELQILRSSLEAGTAGRGSLLLVSGPAGIGKTRILREAEAEAGRLGYQCGAGVALMESLVVYHPWSEALRSAKLDHLLNEESPPRLQALYLVSEAGLPVARAERSGFSEDPALLSMMINNATEFVRDAIPAEGAEREGDLLRLAAGGRGVCVVRAPDVALLAVYEGRETEIFLREVRNLLEDVTRRARGRLDGWDGNKKAVADLARPLSAMLQSGAFDGVDQAADGQARRYNLFDNVLFGLRRRAAGAPLLLVLDDLQWADASSLALLHYVARNTRDAPIVLLGGFRSEERESRPALREALLALAREDLGQEVPLPRLNAPDSRRLAESMLGPHEIAGEFFERVSTVTEGNPLIIREVLRQLRASGILKNDPADGLLRLTRPIDKLEVSSRVRDAVAHRVAALDREERELLDTAAVCGTRFSGATLAAVAGEGELKVVRQLSSISRQHGVIQSTEEGWRFDHPVMREVIYDSMPAELRRLLHKQAGEVLLRTGGSDAVVGEHFAEAGDARAVAPLESAARLAISAGTPDEAARLLEKAVRVVDGSKRAALELLNVQALEHAGRHEEALAAASKAREYGADPIECALARALALQLLSRNDEVVLTISQVLPSADISQAVRLLNMRARTLNELARYAEAEEAANDALARCPKDNLTGRADALECLASSDWFRGRNAKALETTNEVLRTREAAGDKRGISKALTMIGGILGDSGEAQRSIEFLRLGLALYEKMGDRRGTAGARMNIANALSDLGDLTAALDEAKAAYMVAEKIGYPRLMGWSEFVEGLTLARRGQARGALTAFDRAVKRARKIDEPRLLVNALAESVPPRIKVGDRLQAKDDAQEAIEIAQRTGVRLYEAVAVRSRGEVAASERDPKAMEGFFGRALSLFEELQNHTEAAETHVRWAEALQANGRSSEARAHFEQAVAAFEARGLRRRAATTKTSLIALAH